MSELMCDALPAQDPASSDPTRARLKWVIGAGLAMVVITMLVAHPLVAGLPNAMGQGPLLMDGWFYALRLAVAVTFYIGGVLLLGISRITRGFGSPILSEDHTFGLAAGLIVPIVAGIPAALMCGALLMPY